MNAGVVLQAARKAVFSGIQLPEYSSAGWDHFTNPG
jgi:hypothetical protein